MKKTTQRILCFQNLHFQLPPVGLPQRKEKALAQKRAGLTPLQGWYRNLSGGLGWQLLRSQFWDLGPVVPQVMDLISIGLKNLCKPLIFSSFSFVFLQVVRLIEYRQLYEQHTSLLEKKPASVIFKINFQTVMWLLQFDWCSFLQTR